MLHVHVCNTFLSDPAIATTLACIHVHVHVYVYAYSDGGSLCIHVRSAILDEMKEDPALNTEKTSAGSNILPQ